MVAAMSKTFGAKLKELREGRGLSQKEVAEALGRWQSKVHKFETDQSRPEPLDLLTLSRLFGISIEYLVDDALETPEDAPGGLESLPPELRRILEDVKLLGYERARARLLKADDPDPRRTPHDGHATGGDHHEDDAAARERRRRRG